MTGENHCEMVGMTGWEPVSEAVCVHHQVAIAGRVADAQTGRAIAGVRVSLGSGTETITAADGYFHFLDLPAGEYALQASLPGAGTRYGQSDEVTVTVSQDENGKYILDPAELELPPTAIKGRITDKEGKELAMAEVRVVGSGERTYSDGEGNYCLTGLEAGERTVVVSARGYKTVSDKVHLEQGKEKESGFPLARSEGKEAGLTLSNEGTEAG